jgi:hypothetical protein
LTKLHGNFLAVDLHFKWLWIRSCLTGQLRGRNADSVAQNGRGVMRRIFATVSAAVTLAFMSPTTASATDWCTTDPLPPPPNTPPIAGSRTLQDNNHRERPNAFIAPWWKNSHLPNKVWCQVSQSPGEVVSCPGVGRSDCGPYPYMMRNLDIVHSPGETILIIENQHETDTRYVTIYSDYVNPGLHGYLKKECRMGRKKDKKRRVWCP